MKKILNVVTGVARNSTIIAKTGSGCWLTDTSGKSYLDMTSGIGCLSTGHGHPKVIKAVTTQVNNLVMAQQNCVFTHEPQQQLIQQLNEITPNHIDSYYFTNSGSEAVENAIKIARVFTRKQNIISFIGGFHGRTLGGMSLSSSKVSCRKGFSPLLSGIFNLRYPTADIADDVYNDFENLLVRITDPDETAAIIMEPVLGEGGVIQASPTFVKKMRALCDKHNILWISDEVQTGIGRTGTWWGYEHFGVEPDIITFGKGIASGFPLAGVGANKKMFDSIHVNGLGGTYNGHIVSTIAANKTLEIIQEEKLLYNVNTISKLLVTKLEKLEHPLIQNIRAYGLMIAITIDLSPEQFQKCIKYAETYGLMLLTTGITSDIRLLPPLILNEMEVAIFIAKFKMLLDNQI